MSIWILIAIVVIVFILVALYNKLVKLRNNTENAFADINVQLKARFNLVDNLVNTVKWYASHEKELLENVTAARTNFLGAKNASGKIAADNMLTWALKSLFAVAENYPDLKANQNFLQVQNELSDIENKIAAVRRFYNSAVKEYDNGRETFPSNIIAGMFGFKEITYYEVENKEEKTVPKVDFGTQNSKK